MKSTESPGLTSATSSATSIRPSASRKEEIRPEPSRGNLTRSGRPSALRQLGAPELPPPHLLRLRERGRQTEAAGLRPFPSGEASQNRPHIDQETDEDRDRIAREPEHDAIADLAEAHRPSGLDRDLPKMPLAECVDGAHDMVLGALARAAGDDDGMVVAGGVGEGGGHKLGPVGENAEIGGARPGRARRGPQASARWRHRPCPARKGRRGARSRLRSRRWRLSAAHSRRECRAPPPRRRPPLAAASACRPGRSRRPLCNPRPRAGDWRPA